MSGRIRLLWRVKDAGRPNSDRVLDGEAYVDAAVCLDRARSLYETGGVLAVALVNGPGFWPWQWRAAGPKWPIPGGYTRA